jgi:hypothetical protein
MGFTVANAQTEALVQFGYVGFRKNKCDAGRYGYVAKFKDSLSLFGSLWVANTSEGK